MDGYGRGRLREVYAVAYPRLVGQLVGVTGDPAEAEDVVMEAFARAAARPELVPRRRQPRGLAAHGGRQRGAQPLAADAPLDATWSPRWPGPRRTPTCPRTTSP